MMKLNLSKKPKILIIEKLRHIKLPERLKGGIIENSINYVHNVLIDYKNVYLETLKDIRRKPLKASIIGMILLSGGYCIKHNPTFDDYRMQLIEANNSIARVPDPIRNHTSFKYVNRLFGMNNREILRYQSFGLFSIIYLSNTSTENSLYQYQCRYLKPDWYSTIFERILDVGFLDRYRYLDYKIKDYDVNHEEFIESNTK